MASASIQQSYLLTIIIVLAFVTNIYCNKKCDDKPKLDEHGCTVNQTYVDCNYDCPNDWCLENDEPLPNCKPPPPEYCKPGCRCNFNHKKDKYGNCILACDCPSIECTGCNREYDCCPEPCHSQQCEARNDAPVICNTLVLNCEPKCVCRNGTWLNSNNDCVEACDCDDKADSEK